MAIPKSKITLRSGSKENTIYANIRLQDGHRIMVYQPTDEDIISSVTGKVLGKREKVIGVGRIKNGKAILKNASGAVALAEIKRITTPRIGSLSPAFARTGRIKKTPCVTVPSLKVKVIDE